MTTPVPSPFIKYPYIVVEGPIAVGKTSLAQLLANRFSTLTLFEEAKRNPFLARFYQDPQRYALPTQLSFLLKRDTQLCELSHNGAFQHAVAGDFLIAKDALFAQLTLQEDELSLYQRVASSLNLQTPTPDLVIYLQAQPDVLAERIKKRADAAEQGISENYLQKVADAYSRFFHHYDAAPLMIVNTEHLNPVDREEDYELLLRHLQDMRGRRSFFNLG